MVRFYIIVVINLILHEQQQMESLKNCGLVGFEPMTSQISAKHAFFCSAVDIFTIACTS